MLIFQWNLLSLQYVYLLICKVKNLSGFFSDSISRYIFSFPLHFGAAMISFLFDIPSRSDRITQQETFYPLSR